MCCVLQPQKASFLVWADSVSLAATRKIAFAFSSSGYCDVSVPQVCHVYSIYSNKRTVPLQNSRLPHSEIPGSQSTYDSPRHIGVSPVLHRLLVPRHSPYALLHLTSLHLKHFILSSDGSYQLANFLLLPTISQHQFATLIVFPLSRQKTSNSYVDEQSPLLLDVVDYLTLI